MEMSSSQDWMCNKKGPINLKQVCKSKFDIDIDIDPSGDNRIVSKNNLVHNYKYWKS